MQNVGQTVIEEREIDILNKFSQSRCVKGLPVAVLTIHIFKYRDWITTSKLSHAILQIEYMHQCVTNRRLKILDRKGEKTTYINALKFNFWFIAI